MALVQVRAESRSDVLALAGWKPNDCTVALLWRVGAGGSVRLMNEGKKSQNFDAWILFVKSQRGLSVAQKMWPHWSRKAKRL